MSETGNWLSHGFKKAPSFFEAQSALGWGVLLALFALVGVAYLLQGSQAVVSGYRMQQMTTEYKALQEQNTLLEAEIAASQPVSDLQNKAIYLGFVRATSENIEYLTIHDYPSVPGDGLEESHDSTRRVTALDNWWRRMTRGFTGWRKASYSAPSDKGNGF